LAVLIGVIGVAAGFPFIDPLIGLIIVVWFCALRG
jgi:divalent metal cation (Fe/Co/Zn/Cd) transporter